MMEELITFRDYNEFKRACDREYRAQVNGYIRMGYLLRRARDTDILYNSGYKTVSEFAWNEYRLKDDTVSKMINMNERYSENGYSPYLQEKYQGFGTSLLAEMLTISDAVVDALPPEVTRETLREVKREIREENQITPMEVLAEDPDTGQQGLENNLAKVLHQYLRENYREYPELHKAVTKEGTAESVLRILAPSGIGVKMIRIRGLGKFMLSIKGLEQPLELVNVRSNETERYDWEACMEILKRFCPGGKPSKDWDLLYNEPYPEEVKVAPAQEKKPVEAQKKQESKISEERVVEQVINPPEPEGQETVKPQETEVQEKAEKTIRENSEILDECGQTDIENHLEVVQADYIPMKKEEEYLREREAWNEAENYAERIYQILSTHQFDQTEETTLLLERARGMTSHLKEVLQSIWEMTES